MIVEKVTGNAKLVKRYEQNVRLLKDFPWLWGIRQKWTLAYDNIYATKADRTLRDLLNVENLAPDFELWVYLSCLPFQYEVVRIEPREHTPILLQRLAHYLDHHQNGNDLLNVAIVRHVEGDTVTCFRHTEARIYRPENKTTPLMLSLL